MVEVTSNSTGEKYYYEEVIEYTDFRKDIMHCFKIRNGKYITLLKSLFKITNRNVNV